MENKIAKAYGEWVEDNRKLFTDSSLFLRLNHIRECDGNRDWNSVPVQFKEATGHYQSGEIRSFNEVSKEFSHSYGQVVRNGANLPAADLDSYGLYYAYNGILAPVLSTPQFKVVNKTVGNKQGYVIEAPRVPEQIGPKEGIRIGLHVAYAHSLLQGIAKKHWPGVFDYSVGDRYVEPSMRAGLLLNSEELLPDELRSIGRNINSLDRKVVEAISLQTCLKFDLEEARKYFEKFPEIPFEERESHLGTQAHEMKNARSPSIYTPVHLGTICRRLGIDYNPSLNFGIDYKSSHELENGRKALNDPTLFD
ncbi:hypothetical protein FJZ21_03760 [Candidatus Pacearchaeota archaeon]|nr:hypothetical protein [Candidatus Pacearchaeota archaeon]